MSADWRIRVLVPYSSLREQVAGLRAWVRLQEEGKMGRIFPETRRPFIIIPRQIAQLADLIEEVSKNVSQR